MQFVKSIILITWISFYPCAYADINQHVDNIKNNPNSLYAFFKTMPKGGELHYHLAGGAYPEIMLAVAAQDDYCLEKKNWSVVPAKGSCQGISIKELGSHPEMYNQTIRAWSMKDFIAGRESGHDHFFATFYRFLPLFAKHDAAFLAAVMTTAASQNEQYMEIMILPDNAKSASFATESFSINELPAAKETLLANSDYTATTKDTVYKADHLLEKARQHLDCKNSSQKLACNMTVRFQYYVLREQPLANVFAQALNAFEAASQSKTIVGVNLVQAEDGIISLRDYREQMKIFSFLHQAYPQVNISLHAGELSAQSVLPEDTRFHIQDAILTGHAQRIGHGVDIAQEDNAEKILDTMREKQIAVEINLISNKQILNISGQYHPLNYYLNHQVPVVLSTDDEGVLRTDLTTQYVEAVIEHQLDYRTIKQINRNALTYSFLPGKSLWANAKEGIPVDACKDMNSDNCQRYVKGNEKAALQRQLEIKLTHFENQFNSEINTKH